MLASYRWLPVSALIATASLAAGMAPEPDPIPRRWQLDVTIGPMRMASYQLEGQGSKTYLYFTYKVTNNTGQDLLFAPSFELSLGKGEPIRSGRNVPADVTKKLIEQCQNTFLQDQISILGNLLQGSENAREGVVVWELENLKPDKIAVYAAGFSGETVNITPPGAKEKTPPAQVALDQLRPLW